MARRPSQLRSFSLHLSLSLRIALPWSASSSPSLSFIVDLRFSLLFSPLSFAPSPLDLPLCFPLLSISVSPFSPSVVDTSSSLYFLHLSLAHLNCPILYSWRRRISLSHDPCLPLLPLPRSLFPPSPSPTITVPSLPLSISLPLTVLSLSFSIPSSPSLDLPPFLPLLSLSRSLNLLLLSLFSLPVSILVDLYLPLLSIHLHLPPTSL